MVAINRQCLCTRDFVALMVNYIALNTNDRKACVGAAPKRVSIKC